MMRRDLLGDQINTIDGPVGGLVVDAWDTSLSQFNLRRRTPERKHGVRPVQVCRWEMKVTAGQRPR